MANRDPMATIAFELHAIRLNLEEMANDLHAFVVRESNMSHNEDVNNDSQKEVN